MSDYLGKLAARQLGYAPAIQPLRASRFEPSGPAEGLVLAAPAVAPPRPGRGDAGQLADALEPASSTAPSVTPGIGTTAQAVRPPFVPPLGDAIGNATAPQPSSPSERSTRRGPVPATVDRSRGAPPAAEAWRVAPGQAGPGAAPDPPLLRRHRSQVTPAPAPEPPPSAPPAPAVTIGGRQDHTGSAQGAAGSALPHLVPNTARRHPEGAGAAVLEAPTPARAEALQSTHDDARQRVEAWRIVTDQRSPSESAPRAGPGPTIKVTIGRIEVRALTPAAPVQVKHPPRQGPRLTLEAYLAQRDDRR
jgi:hypothetical protein